MNTLQGKVHVLVVDDDVALVEVCSAVLEEAGYEVTACEQGTVARDLLRNEDFDVALIDLHLPRISGLKVMEAGLKANPSLFPIIMTVDSSIESSVEALAQGAFTYLPKPFSASHLKLFVGQAAHYARVSRERTGAPEVPGLPPEDRHPAVLGESPALKRTLSVASRVAGSHASVFLYGETGTGKELLARFIHARSRRAERPMLSVNCAALPEHLLESEMFGHRQGAFTGAIRERRGILEAANGGTLFLDEITEMSPRIQAKLLRVIQDGEVRRVGSDRVDAVVDIRFITATNRSPDVALADGRLHEGLYYRLRVVPLIIPPLRERAEDIPILAHHFLERYWAENQPDGSPVPHLGPEAIRELQGRRWPGNVREMQNVLEHLVVLTDPGAEVRAADIPTLSVPPPTRNPSHIDFAKGRFQDARQEVTDEFERGYLEWVVGESNGNLSGAARIADMDQATLTRLLAKHGLPMGGEDPGDMD